MRPASPLPAIAQAHGRPISTPVAPRATLHDLRHTFVCQRLARWYREGRDLDRHVLALSTYVGHAKVTDTYWYVTATPELLALAARRVQGAHRSWP